MRSRYTEIWETAVKGRALQLAAKLLFARYKERLNGV